MSTELPKRVRVDFGPHRPMASYIAPAEVIARFLAALKEWNPDYVATVETDIPENTPEMPCWRLWIWD